MIKFIDPNVRHEIITLLNSYGVDRNCIEEMNDRELLNYFEQFLVKFHTNLSRIDLSLTTEANNRRVFSAAKVIEMLKNNPDEAKN